MSDNGQTQETDGGRPEKILVVGVGASASAKDSLERFFSKLTVGPDQAFVLVLQHREALDEAWFADNLKHLTGIVLADAADGGKVKGGTIYLCPANMITTLQNDRFAVRRAEQAPGERATIDSFLVSLAKDRAERSIGIVLAGVGGDGTLGVGTLKDHGGLAIAERSEERRVGKECRSRWSPYH